VYTWGLPIMKINISRWASRGSLLTCSLMALFFATSTQADSPEMARPVYVQDSPAWAAQRQSYYTQDQGSQLVPLAWLRALDAPGGGAFLADGLLRYGYLPNPQSPDGLPVGFTVNGTGPAAFAGMNCAACHTRQIEVGGQAYRIDGGPALSDFQALLTDLVNSLGAINDHGPRFSAFATKVLGPDPTPNALAQLQIDVDIWYARESTMLQRAYPHPGQWGLGRLDAVSMIFNRLTGLDIGPAPTYIIANNIQLADAPVRYPFVWNAPKQDRTQWPGFADNGDNLLGLARNLGEVYGVFARFHPRHQPIPFVLTKTNFLGDNSANFDGLSRLENLIEAIPAPKYPWSVDVALATKGKAVFDLPVARGGCAACHDQRPGKKRFLNKSTWATPVQDVGTDSREYTILDRTAQAGSLTGARMPFGATVQPTDKQFTMLGVSVIGSILQRALQFPKGPDVQAFLKGNTVPTKDLSTRLKGAYRKKQDTEANPDCNKTTKPYCYESRVLYGIWAAAPYLHNGSVPTLADLLAPVDQRPASFALGRIYDPSRVGLAAVQPGSPFTRTTTDCTKRGSGESRCGHTFGTKLSDPQKEALLEYLKTL